MCICFAASEVVELDHRCSLNLAFNDLSVSPISLGKMKVDLVLWYAQCFLMVLPYFEDAESKFG